MHGFGDLNRKRSIAICYCKIRLRDDSRLFDGFIMVE